MRPYWKGYLKLALVSCPIARLVLSKRERVIALEPYDKGLLGTTLRYPYEVRKAEDYFCDLPDLTIARFLSR